MSGFFGVTSREDCVFDLFFGIDYHSHLGTRRGGMVVYGEDAISAMRAAIKEIRKEVPAMLGEEPRMTENVMHGSDKIESAEAEIALFKRLAKDGRATNPL